MSSVNVAKKRRLKRQLYIAVPVIIVVSFYLAGFMSAISTLEEHVLSPITHFRLLGKGDFQWIWFFLNLLILSILFGVYVYYTWVLTPNKDKLGRNFSLSRGEMTYGESHFAEPEEYKDVALVQNVNRAYGTILGMLDDEGKKVINLRMDNPRGNRNMFITGLSGGGKSYGVTSPMIYQIIKRRESAIISDPDGSMFRLHARFAKERGFVVKHLDFNDPLKSDGWDCLRSILDKNGMPDKNIEEQAQVFAQTVVMNAADSDANSVYINGSISILKALILLVAQGREYGPGKPKERSFPAAYKTLLEYDNLDEPFDTARGTDYENCRLPYLAVKASSPNLLGNIRTNLAVMLQTLQSENIQRMLSINDIDLDLPGEVPSLYFVSYPDEGNIYKPLTSLFFSMLFARLYANAKKSDKPLPVHVTFLMEEMLSLGAVPALDDKLATMRKHNISTTLIIQDIPRFADRYPAVYKSMIANCGTKLVLSVGEDETAKLITDMIGETSVATTSERYATITSILALYRPQSVGVGKRNLLTSAELQKMDKDHLLILFSGHEPIYARKFRRPLHPYDKLQTPTLKTDIPDMTDSEGRKKMLIEDAKLRRLWYMNHPDCDKPKDWATVIEADLKAEEEEELTLVKKPKKTAVKLASKPAAAQAAPQENGPIKVIFEDKQPEVPEVKIDTSAYDDPNKLVEGPEIPVLLTKVSSPITRTKKSK